MDTMNGGKGRIKNKFMDQGAAECNLSMVEI